MTPAALLLGAVAACAGMGGAGAPMELEIAREVDGQAEHVVICHLDRQAIKKYGIEPERIRHHVRAMLDAIGQAVASAAVESLTRTPPTRAEWRPPDSLSWRRTIHFD